MKGAIRESMLRAWARACISSCSCSCVCGEAFRGRPAGQGKGPRETLPQRSVPSSPRTSHLRAELRELFRRLLLGDEKLCRCA